MYNEEHKSWSISERFGLPEHAGDLMVKLFNSSFASAHLSPMAGAIEYVEKLHKIHGVVFHAVTSYSDCPWAIQARLENLQRYFGNAIDRVVSDTFHNGKEDMLKPYENSGLIWIEDSPRNAILGTNMGLSSILLSQDYNLKFDNDKEDVVRCDSWKEIYEYLTYVEEDVQEVTETLGDDIDGDEENSEGHTE